MFYIFWILLSFTHIFILDYFHPLSAPNMKQEVTSDKCLNFWHDLSFARCALKDKRTLTRRPLIGWQKVSLPSLNSRERRKATGATNSSCVLLWLLSRAAACQGQLLYLPRPNGNATPALARRTNLCVRHKSTFPPFWHVNMTGNQKELLPTMSLVPSVDLARLIIYYEVFSK